MKFYRKIKALIWFLKIRKPALRFMKEEWRAAIEAAETGKFSGEHEVAVLLIKAVSFQRLGFQQKSKDIFISVKRIISNEDVFSIETRNHIYNFVNVGLGFSDRKEVNSTKVSFNIKSLFPIH